MLSKEEAREAVPGIKGKWAGGMVTPSDGRAEPFVAVPALARAATPAGGLDRGELRGAHDRDGGRADPRRMHRARAGEDRARRAPPAARGPPALPGTQGSTCRSSSCAPPWAAPVPRPDATFRTSPRRGSRCAGARTAATPSRPAISWSHYLCRHSFRYFKKFLPLLKLSARDVRIRLKPPAGHPGAWARSRAGPAARSRRSSGCGCSIPRPRKLVRRRLAERLPRRAPWLGEAGIAEIWAGMIDVTPDAVPYILRGAGTGRPVHRHRHERPRLRHRAGRRPGPADLVLGRPPGHDLARFRFGRFADGSPIVPGPY